MKPKDALLKDRFPGVKPGKGRLSGAAKERCQWLVDNKGYTIDGYTKSTVSSTGAVVTPKPVVPVAGAVADVRDESYPENAFRATYVTEAGEVITKGIGMRDVCNTCHNSFTYHWCDSPTKYVNNELVVVRLVAVSS